jgi:RNA polymerase sigma-70 factor (ECF subfamily)
MAGVPDTIPRITDPAHDDAAAATRLSVTEVHERHGEFVWRTLHRMGVRAPHIEDVYQEVFLVVHQRLGAFAGRSAITTWLYEICFRVTIGYRRKAHFRREELVHDWSQMDSLKSEAPSPERQLATAREAKQLERILDGLALEYRVVFVMFEIEGLSCEQISVSLGVPVGTVHSRLYRARKQFARALSRSNSRRKESGP